MEERSQTDNLAPGTDHAQVNSAAETEMEEIASRNRNVSVSERGSGYPINPINSDNGNRGMSVSKMDGDLEEIRKNLVAVLGPALSKELARISSRTEQIDETTLRLTESVNRLEVELKALREDFNRVVAEREKEATVQKAVSELIRVRQEIDQKYGKYSEIRETMIGILQATDAAIVRKSTISRVSEELMLFAPRYWLAPCLIAVAAWISNDQVLANRAIQEALKRDEEKTALAMALICRRNGRIRTAHEWLSLYFSKQSIEGFTEDSFTYVDAYVNGVFGPDEAHLCQGYMEKWLQESKKKIGDFETKQISRWKEYCKTFFRHVDDEFPTLSTNTKNYPEIEAEIGRIRSVDDLKSKFQLISDAFIDREKMVARIDQELVRLVSTYDENEVKIRDEEYFLQLIKKYDGDKDKAKEELEKQIRRRKQKKVNLIDQMTKQLTEDVVTTTPSKQKTAMVFLTPYINEGFHQYITENRQNFPEQVEITYDKWTGHADGQNDFERLCDEYKESLQTARAAEIQLAQKGKMIQRLILGVVLCIAAVALALYGHNVLAIGAAVLALVSFGASLYAKRNSQKNVAEIIRKYDQKLADGEEKIRNVLDEWQKAKDIVSEFDKESSNLRVAV